MIPGVEVERWAEVAEIRMISERRSEMTAMPLPDVSEATGAAEEVISPRRLVRINPLTWETVSSGFDNR